MKIWKNTGTLDSLVPEMVRDLVDCSEAEIAVIGSKPIDLSALPKLKGLFKCGVGADNVPFDECAKRGIAIGLPSAKTASVIFDETASFAASLVFRMLYSQVGDLEHWLKVPRTSASKKVVLVIGLGNIGKRVVARLEPTVNVLGFDLAVPGCGDLDQLISIADVVTLHIPLDEGNRGFWDERKLGLMKNGAALVNTARGPVVEEDALFSELSSGRLRAAFDVFWQEPYAGRLKSLYPDPFYMTPHVASTCQDFIEGLADDFHSFTKSF